MAIAEFIGLQLSADDVRQLTGWGDAMVEDYISVVQALNNIQSGGTTDEEILNEVKELLESHIENIENPHLTSLVNLVDTLITNESNDDIIMMVNGRWTNVQLSDVLGDCCKDLIIISAQAYDKILSSKDQFDIGMRNTVDGLNTDYIGVQIISQGDIGFSTTIASDGVRQYLGASEQNGNINWNDAGTIMCSRKISTNTQIKFKHNHLSGEYSLVSWLIS